MSRSLSGAGQGVGPDSPTEPLFALHCRKAPTHMTMSHPLFLLVLRVEAAQCSAPLPPGVLCWIHWIVCESMRGRGRCVGLDVLLVGLLGVSMHGCVCVCVCVCAPVHLYLYWLYVGSCSLHYVSVCLCACVRVCIWSSVFGRLGVSDATQNYFISGVGGIGARLPMTLS